MKTTCLFSVLRPFLLTIIIMAFSTVPVFSQSSDEGSGSSSDNPLENAIKQMEKDLVGGYLQPFVDGFGANMNSGLYRTAEIGDGGFSFELRFIGIGTLIGDAEKTYKAIAPLPYDQTSVKTATVFGGLGETVPGPAGLTYQFQNGQVKTSMIPFAMPQLVLGNFFATQLTLSYVPIPKIQDFPKTTLIRIGARHSISRYLPQSPVDIAAGLSYNSLEIGDIFDAKAFNIGAQASKSWSVFTLYGGLQYENSSMTVDYTQEGKGTQIHLDLDGQNHIRATFGVGLNLLILHFNGDINLGKVTVVSGGIGIGS